MPVCFIEARRAFAPKRRSAWWKRSRARSARRITSETRLSSCANIQRKMSRRMAASNPKNPKILEALKKIGA